MLAIHIHAKRNFSCKTGTRVLPVVTWETAQPQIRIWRKAIRKGHLGAKRKMGDFITLLKIPDKHPVLLVVGVQDKKQLLEYYPLSKMPVEDREILEYWFNDSSYEGPALVADSLGFVPELVVGAPLSKSEVKWTKDMRLLYGKEKRKEKNVNQ
ncbi:hypothetical protein [Sphaerothrix gracilis]|uniref:hypothetical protein n=1 Tax=Sphaerothrix gracilis TaxID=3151835 RepID=UPI0031FBF70E